MKPAPHIFDGGKASTPTLPAKLGHPSDRQACAQFARANRARLPTLAGGWTRSQWNHQVSQATANKLAVMTRARKEYIAPTVAFRAIYDEAQADARAIVADREQFNRDVDAAKLDEAARNHKMLVRQIQAVDQGRTI